MQEPTTFDLDEIELVLLDAVEARATSYHRVGYAWEAMKRCGHIPQHEVRFNELREKLIGT